MNSKFSNKLDPKEMEELAMNEAAIQTALDAAMDALKIPEEKRAKYRVMVTNK